MSIGEGEEFEVDEVIVLSKFEGDPIPENEFERIHIKNGEIVARQSIKNGLVVAEEVAPGGVLGNLPERPKRPTNDGGRN